MLRLSVKLRSRESVKLYSFPQVHCDVEEDVCRKWNKERAEKGESTYDDKM